MIGEWKNTDANKRMQSLVSDATGDYIIQQNPPIAALASALALRFGTSRLIMRSQSEASWKIFF
jgi:hypothetical protein